jgi:PIN domain nuclease of toxin-antitoxin system
VVDASAVVALVRGESGHEWVLDRLEGGAAISAVNWSEVLGVQGGAAESLRHGLEALGLSVVDFTAADAALVAEMLVPTRQLGLGLADRACLALGHRLDVPVVTADRAWAELGFGPTVELIR